VNDQVVRHQRLIQVPVELRTERLRLRPVQPSDAPALFAAIDESRNHLDPWLEWPARIQNVADAEDLCAKSSTTRAYK
jgi:RimJ/RimL family protein N-acetyltransferase